MASYQVENDIVGGGGLGFGGGFGGGCGLLVVLIILFAVFSGGGLFGRRDCDHDDRHDRDFDELRSRFTNPCGCVSNCQIDKDVVTSRDAGIIEQKCIYEKQLQAKISEQNGIIQEQKNQLFLSGMFSELQENLNARFGMIEKELEHKPNVVPVFAETVSACVRDVDRCGGERFERRRFRDRDDDCCFC